MSADVWVLGATGRTGTAIARKLMERGIPPVLVGRNRDRLEASSREYGTSPVVAASVAEMAQAIRRERPAVVVNTVGPFQRTGAVLADAATAGGHYVDLANDLATILAHRDLDTEVRRSGHTIVTGAGFGVTATESLLTWLTASRHDVREVRIDMIPSMAVAAGRLGEALAGSLFDGIPDVPGGHRFEGRRIADSTLAPAPIAGDPITLVTPDGDEVISALMPLGELLAAQRACGAPLIESGSSEAPSGMAGSMMRGMMSVMRVGVIRRGVIRMLSGMKVPERPAPRRHSWAHARIALTDGTAREGWLRMGEAGDVTATTAAEVASRLLAGDGAPGVFTPAELFGAGLAESCGGMYSLVDEAV